MLNFSATPSWIKSVVEAQDSFLLYSVLCARQYVRDEHVLLVDCVCFFFLQQKYFYKAKPIKTISTIPVQKPGIICVNPKFYLKY